VSAVIVMVGVPEHFRHRLEVRAAGQREGRGAVPEVMEPDRWKAAFRASRSKCRLT
jgi:hypothetical protein